jgi:hypothetical protein
MGLAPALGNQAQLSQDVSAVMKEVQALKLEVASLKSRSEDQELARLDTNTLLLGLFAHLKVPIPQLKTIQPPPARPLLQPINGDGRIQVIPSADNSNASSATNSRAQSPAPAGNSNADTAMSDDAKSSTAEANAQRGSRWWPTFGR